MIDILNRWTRTVMFRDETAQTIGEAALAAYKRGADLRGADLRGAVLRGAVLRDAVLRGAVLRDAVLRGAVLRGEKVKAHMQLIGVAEWGCLTAFLMQSGGIHVTIGCRYWPTIEAARQHWKDRDGRVRSRTALDWIEQWAKEVK